MQLRLPRAKDEKPRKKRPPIVSTADSAPCGICHKQISQYTCPKCNLPYCSLACFRSTEHQACTESFDRTTLVEDLRGDKDDESSETDKRQMLEMLKKFEDQQRELEEIKAQDGAPAAEVEEDDGPEAEARRREREELEKRLADVDLDSLPSEQILSLLSPAQQQAFTEALQDPTRVSKLVEEEFEGEEPWWTIEQERKAFDEFRNANKEAMQAEEKAGGEDVAAGVGTAMEEEPEIEWEEVRPPLLDPKQLPPLKVGPDGKAIANPQLLHNIVAVLFAYSFTLRTFSLTSLDSIPARSPERITIVQVLAQLLPFLVQRSTASFHGLEDAIEYVAAREEPQGMSPPLIALLLHDVASLLRPVSIAAITSPDAPPFASHALVNVIAALSDVQALFTSANAPPPPPSSSGVARSPSAGPTVSKPLIARPSTTSPLTKSERQQCSLASAKLLFYTSFAVSTGNEVVQACGALATLAEREAARRAQEEQEREAAVERRRAELGHRGKEVDDDEGAGGHGPTQDETQPEEDIASREPQQGVRRSAERTESAPAAPKIVELE